LTAPPSPESMSPSTTRLPLTIACKSVLRIPWNGCSASRGTSAQYQQNAHRSKKEQITDEDVESWKPALKREAVFA
jgi:hypothetical protein